jgi:tetratricopeptide (TPR) repeat protein
MSSSRSILLLALAASSLAARPMAAQVASAGRSIEILEPSEQACRAARALRRNATALCVVGRASDPAGVERVLLNGQPARLTPDSAGGVRFVGWVMPGTGQTRVEVTLEPKGGGEKLVQPYGFTPDVSTGADGTAYTVTNLAPRVLGAASATAVAQAAPPAPAPVPVTQVAQAPATAAAPSTSTEPASSPATAEASATPAQPASAEPSPASPPAAAPSTAPSTTPSTAVAASSTGAPVPAAQAIPSATPATTPAGSTAAPAVSAAPAEAAPTVSAVEDAHTYVQILEPKEWSGMATRGIMVAPRSSLRVIGLAQHSSGVARIDVNGVRASYSPDPSGAARFVAFVPAEAGRSDVEIVVRGNSGPPLVKHYEVSPAPAPAVQMASGSADAVRVMGSRFRGKRWAVVVGVSRYADAGINSLHYADADAQAFYEFLRSPRAGGGGFADENIRLLLNDHATYREIRSALFTFLKGATEDDEVVIYFAGHGAPDPQRLQNLYLLTYDTDLGDISGTAFPMDDMSKAIHGLYAHDVVVITDACHSAGIGGQGGTRDLGTNQINDLFLQSLNASTGGLAIFTASGTNQLSQEDARWGGGHGVFTHYLLDGLNGAADEDGDRIVSLTEMMEYARGKVRTDTRNAQIPTISQTNYDPYLPMSVVLDPATSTAALASASLPSTPAPVPAAAGRDASAPAPAARPAVATPEQAAAIASAQEAVGLFPNSAVYRKRLAVALRDAGRLQEAVHELQEAARLDSGNADIVYELGVTLRAAGMDREAAAQFEAATRADSRNGTYFNALGSTLLALGQTDEALDGLRRAVSLGRDAAAFHRDLGAALVKAGRASDAVGELRQAVALEPRNASYHTELADALAGAGRQDEALLAYREATVIEPTNAGHKAAYARALQAAGQSAQAEAELRSAVQLDGRNASYHHDHGVLLRDQGKPYEVLVEFREAARLEPGNPQYRYDLGVALAGAAQAADALAELKEAVKLQPGNASYQNALGIALKAGSPQEALAALREAVKLAPDNARYHYDLAMLLRDLGDASMVEQAVTELEAATRLDPRNRDYRTELTALRNRSRND